jgi:hypothetical protein
MKKLLVILGTLILLNGLNTPSVQATDLENVGVEDTTSPPAPPPPPRPKAQCDGCVGKTVPIEF